MTKKITKIVIALLAVVMMISFAGPAFAAEGDAAGDSGFSATMFDDVSYEDGGASDSITSMIASIINMVRIIGMGVAVIMLIVLAIKYISAAPGDKADIKKHAVVYVVGAVVLFAASGILGIIQKWAENVG